MSRLLSRALSVLIDGWCFMLLVGILGLHLGFGDSLVCATLINVILGWPSDSLYAIQARLRR